MMTESHTWQPVSGVVLTVSELGDRTELTVYNSNNNSFAALKIPKESYNELFLIIDDLAKLMSKQ